MNINVTTAIIAVCLGGAVLLGMQIRRLLPEDHLNADTRDVVKLTVGLIATMSALLLGLLVSSAKSSFDTARGEVIQLAAKATFLDRVLGMYGPEAAPLRTKVHAARERAIQELWPQHYGASALDTQTGDALYAAIQSLSPRDDTQRTLKDQAASQCVEIAELRTLLRAQSLPSISILLLAVVVLWLVIIFFGFSLLAPSNSTAALALIVSALSVAGAIFLILEMDRPFTGLIQISSEPLAKALSQTPH